METIYRSNSFEKPKLIAHRGFAVGMPQNSLPSFETAGKLGFWAIETDVHMTEDGVLVCCHDATVDSMFNGSGAIRQMSFASLRQLIFRDDKCNGCKFPGPMPTFREYLQICRQYGSIPFIETKTEDIAEVLDAAGEFFREEEIVISSAQFSHLEAVRRITDKVFIHHIFSDEERMNRLAQMGNSGLSFNYPNYRECPTELLEKARASGVQVCLRAGDTQEAVRDMIALGLNYIPTNCIAGL
jgi:glycerophosphoryl diester phosphodiesterase